MIALRHPHRDRGNDCYSTPPVAVDALLAVESLPYRIWEPAGGHGNIVHVLRDADHVVIASDIMHYTFSLDFEDDFLRVAKAPAGVEAIVINPPFKITTEFTRHALDLVLRVYLLLRLAFLESTSRTDILEQRGLASVHVFRNRLPMLHRDGWTGNKASSAIPFAWFCWDRHHVGDATIKRIS
jgi:hypothetical protein